MRKRKQPFESLQERSTTPFTEQWAIKYPGEEIIPADRNRKYGRVYKDKKVMKEEYEKHGRTPYSIVHTHPNQGGRTNIANPSSGDLINFLSNSNAQSLHIVLYAEKTMEPLNAIAIKKTKKTPGPNSVYNLVFPYLARKFMKRIPILRNYLSSERKLTKDIIDKYHLKTRRIPIVDETGEMMQRVSKTTELLQKHIDEINEKQKDEMQQNSLETKVAGAIFIGSLVFLIFFSYPTLTGNSIVNIPINASNNLSLLFLLLSLISGIIYVIKNSKSKN